KVSETYLFPLLAVFLSSPSFPPFSSPFSPFSLSPLPFFLLPFLLLPPFLFSPFPLPSFFLSFPPPPLPPLPSFLSFSPP
ncbi:hypothetical protein ACXWRW_11490, partial [Streptococcus pyogenes]